MDKIAIISDIHGNIPALEAVLKDIESRGISRIICLGDIAGKGPDSALAVDRIKECCEAVVMGNWDYLIAGAEEHEILTWHRNILGEDRLKYMRALPLYTEVSMSGRLIRLCHASVKDVFYRIRATDSYEHKLKLFQAPQDELRESDVLGYGDIHQAYVDNFSGKTIFNVGSVGNPLEITQSSYGIIEGQCGSKVLSSFSISLIRVPYDIDKAIDMASNSGMPTLQEYIKELRTAEYRGVQS